MYKKISKTKYSRIIGSLITILTIKRITRLLKEKKMNRKTI